MTAQAVTPESLFDIAYAEDPQLGPDGSMVAFVRMQPDARSNTYRRAIWLVPSDGSAPARQISAGVAADYAPRWSPDGRSLVFVSNRDGSPQLYALPLDGGEPRKLCEVYGGVEAPAYSPDGTYVAFIGRATQGERELEDAGHAFDGALGSELAEWHARHRERLRDPRVITRLPYRTGTSYFDGQYRHVYVVDAAGGKPRRITGGDFHHAAPAWTADSRAIVTNSNREQSSGEELFELWSTILRVDVETGAEQIVAFEVSEEERPVAVSPDGRWVAYTWVAKAASPYQEQYHVAVSPIDGGEPRVVTADSEVTAVDFAWDADSEYLLLTIHEGGDSKLARMHRDGGVPEILLDGPRFIGQVCPSRDGQRLAYCVTTPAMPSEVYAYDRAGGAERQLTRLNTAWTERHALSEPLELRYRGAGDVEVQGWYLRPTNFDATRSYPLAVEIHGGPQIMWGNSFSHEFQVLASAGYFVFYCNPRGSSGYGAEFQRLRGKGGYADAPDIIAGMDLVLEREHAADGERLVVTGGSYGGFLTGWIVGHYDRFKAAFAQRGVYDQLNMFGSGDIPESVEWYHNGIPRAETLSELWEYSPAAYAEQVKTPLLIKHAELDYRVPISQAETFFHALRRHGNRDAVLLRYPREGHGLSRGGEPAHRVDRLERIVAWFDRYVRPEQPDMAQLAPEQLAVALAQLPAWSAADGGIVRSFVCGTIGVAGGLAERAARLAEGEATAPRLTIDGDRLEVRLRATQPDLAFARTLDRRIWGS